MKLLAFAASTSSKSINKQLVSYAASLLQEINSKIETEVIDLRDYDMPVFSTDKEEELGSPEPAQRLFKKIGEADALLISFAEHNGSYTAAFKNIYDWTSRVDAKVYQNKPMVILATSPGPGGGKNVLATAKSSIPHFGGKVVADMCMPGFYENFDADGQAIVNKELDDKLKQALRVFDNL